MYALSYFNSFFYKSVVKLTEIKNLNTCFSSRPPNPSPLLSALSASSSALGVSSDIGGGSIVWKSLYAFKCLQSNVES